jgi:hypothetical protein
MYHEYYDVQTKVALYIQEKKTAIEVDIISINKKIKKSLIKQRKNIISCRNILKKWQTDIQENPGLKKNIKMLLDKGKYLNLIISI